MMENTIDIVKESQPSKSQENFFDQLRQTKEYAESYSQLLAIDRANDLSKKAFLKCVNLERLINKFKDESLDYVKNSLLKREQREVWRGAFLMRFATRSNLSNNVLLIFLALGFYNTLGTIFFIGGPFYWVLASYVGYSCWSAKRELARRVAEINDDAKYIKNLKFSLALISGPDGGKYEVLSPDGFKNRHIAKVALGRDVGELNKECFLVVVFGDESVYPIFCIDDLGDSKLHDGEGRYLKFAFEHYYTSLRREFKTYTEALHDFDNRHREHNSLTNNF